MRRPLRKPSGSAFLRAEQALEAHRAAQPAAGSAAYLAWYAEHEQRLAVFFDERRAFFRALRAEQGSGCLGLTQAEWETGLKHPQPEPSLIGLNYPGAGDIALRAGRIWFAAFLWDAKYSASAAAARALGELFLPHDAEYVDTIKRGPNTVHRYRSAWLAGLFDAQDFQDGEPGDLTVQHDTTHGRHTHLMIAIGGA